MTSLILVGRPETRHIMVLAMAAPAVRERQWGDYPLDDSLSRIVSGHVSRWILARRGEQDIEVIWTRNYVARQTNLYAFHFTPTSCSWLNAVEGFFAKLTKRRLKRGTFRSINDLQAAINRSSTSIMAWQSASPGPQVQTKSSRPSGAGTKR